MFEAKNCSEKSNDTFSKWLSDCTVNDKVDGWIKYKKKIVEGGENEKNCWGMKAAVLWTIAVVTLEALLRIHSLEKEKTNYIRVWVK